MFLAGVACVTTLEHALLAINGVLATGLHRRYGWQLAAVAGVAANVPDWDGLTFLVSWSAFAAGHRLWGHNLAACVLLGSLLGLLDFRFDLVTRVARRGLRTLRIRADLPLRPRAAIAAGLAVSPQGQAAGGPHWATCGLWTAVAVLAALSHLLADMLVSGTATLPDWEVRLWWPFADRGWVWPLVRWGDPGMTILFVLGMSAAVRWPRHCSGVAWATLVAVGLYMACRGLQWA